MAEMQTGVHYGARWFKVVPGGSTGDLVRPTCRDITRCTADHTQSEECEIVMADSTHVDIASGLVEALSERYPSRVSFAHLGDHTSTVVVEKEGGDIAIEIDIVQHVRDEQIIPHVEEGEIFESE